MIREIKKLAAAFRFGGIKAAYYRAKGKNEFKRYLYQVAKKTDPKDYPKLLKKRFELETGKKLDLDHPQTYNEKIQWMKLYDSTPLKTQLADKYRVREWIREKIGDQYLIPLLGVWYKFDDIDFDSLPDQFALKCNHGCGYNYIVKDKKAMNMEYARKKFEYWLKRNYTFVSCRLELHYKDIKPCIIAEKYIEQMDGNLYDYKIHVFNGEPKIIQVIGDRDLNHHKAREAFFDPDWNQVKLANHTYESYDILPKKPEKLQQMLQIAEKLGSEFTYVRVDLYDLSGDIKFGEMTFAPKSGFGKWGGKGTVFSQLMDLSTKPSTVS